MFFEKILIANRGEIAVRIIRACRALGIAAAAVYSEADRGALHVRLADEAHLIGPAPAPASYLDAERIVRVARACGAQAIHPGYGFLAERAHFARLCREAGLVFIGPPPEAIALMGSKTAAKRLAASVGVPTVPGYTGDDQDPETLRREAARIGLPLLIKASAGGGGRGMRVVHDMAAFDEALASARREAQAAFGDDALFLERLIERPRHVEVQVLADAHGNVVHLFERECSIQRRHQKIVEESPSPVLTPGLRAAMGEAAVRLARAAGYINAGTLEFLLNESGPGAHESRPYYFLEMNTRLQVEHPVTEAVTGLDLVELQIAIAAGAPLPFRQEELRQEGHAIEVRICAEDPATYLPAAGRLALFDPPSGAGVRNDAGATTGDALTVHYDPMFAKLIVHAPSRVAAVARLRRALDDYAVLGVTTNLPLLRAIAAHPAFAAGATHTAFLEEHDLAAGLQQPASVPGEVLLAAALFEAIQPPSSRPPCDPWDLAGWHPGVHNRVARYTADGAEHAVALSYANGAWRAEAGGATYTAHVLESGPSTLMIALAGLPTSLLQQALNTSEGFSPERTERFRLARAGDALHVLWRGCAYRLDRPAPLSVETLGAHRATAGGHAGLEAPMPGTVVKVLASEGQEVAAHQPLVVLEAMKMEHIVAAPHRGVVRRLHVAPGTLVARGAPLVELDEA
ncbi:MAG TPA: biotin carboxylase N-terminal domain-containing protein [Roseiflexaceae bacterium]|nr:biotin carboxylase N-terminal domain-containing protein [Roseiflexaceae bacterium]